MPQNQNDKKMWVHVIKTAESEQWKTVKYFICMKKNLLFHLFMTQKLEKRSEVFVKYVKVYFKYYIAGDKNVDENFEKVSKMRIFVCWERIT